MSSPNTPNFRVDFSAFGSTEADDHSDEHTHLDHGHDDDHDHDDAHADFEKLEHVLSKLSPAAVEAIERRLADLPDSAQAKFRDLSTLIFEHDHDDDEGPGFPDKDISSDNDDGFGGTSATTDGAPSPLGDLADYLVSGYWNDRGSSIGARAHNVTDSGNDANDGVLYFNVTGYSDDSDGITAERAFLVREAFKVFGETLGITFIETTSTDEGVVDFFFRDNGSGANASSSYFFSGDVTVSKINVNAGWSGGTSTYNDYTLQTIFHEIGHALGLGHQGNYNGSASYGTHNTFDNDSWQASMMSYFSQNENTSITASNLYLQTPMSVDWMALDDLYGSQGYGTSNAFTEDTVWGFNTTVTSEVSDIWAQWSSYADVTASTIVDGAGNDTLDLSGFDNNAVINLNASSRLDTSPALSDIGGKIGNLSIAEGTIIENAIGGGAGEVFYGNAANNILTGNGGDDLFYDSQGSDTYYGGTGSDTVYFGSAFADYTFDLVGAFLEVVDLATDFVDATVEWLDFAGQVFSFEELAGGVPDNAAPTASGETADVTENGTTSGNVLDNDTDPDGDPLSVSAVNGSATDVGETITLQSGALLTLNSNGLFDYDPNGAFDALNDGETATDSFSYEATDGRGGTSTATVTVTINGYTPPPPNVAPVAGNDTATVAEDVVLSGLNVLDNDQDADNDTLTITAIDGTSLASGEFVTLSSGARVTLNADGTLDYDQRGAFDALDVGETGEDIFTYRISDGEDTSTASVTVTINGAFDNVVPVAENDTATVSEDATVTGNVLTNDQDDNGDAMVVTSLNGSTAAIGNQITLASGALLTLNADGSFDYDPNGAFDTLEDGETGTDSFTYAISDGRGGSDTATVSLEITGVSPPNDAPTAGDDSADVDEDSLLQGLAVLSNDSDLNGDALSVTQIDGQTISAGNFVTLASGARVTLNADGTLDYDQRGAFDALDVGESTTEVFSYQISDGRDFAVASVSITINGTFDNSVPVADNDTATVSEDATVTGNVLGNDSDDNGDALTVTALNGQTGAIGNQITLASGALVTLLADGSFDYDPNGAFDQLDTSQTGNDSFTYTVADGRGGTDTATVNVTINGYSVPVTTTPLTVDFEGLPTGAYTGEGGLTFDGLSVTSGNSINGSRYAEGTNFTIMADGEDFDLNSASFRSGSGRVRIEIEAFDDGVLVGTATVNSRTNRVSDVSFGTEFDSIDEVRFTANGTALIDDLDFVTRTEVLPGGNEAPTADDDSADTGEADTVTLDLLSNDSDPDGDAISLVSVNGNASGSVTLASGATVTFASDGQVTYDPNGAFDNLNDGETEQDSFVYQISDDRGGVAEATATVTIAGSGTPPPPPPEPTEVVIDFEGLGAAGAYTEDGMVFANVAPTSARTGVSSGDTAGESTGNSIVISHADGFDFDFESAVVTAQSGKNVSLLVQGFDEAGDLIGSQSVRIRDNKETLISFDDAKFDVVDEIVLTASSGLILDDVLIIV